MAPVGGPQDVNPLAVMFSTTGTGEQTMLFRYPTVSNEPKIVTDDINQNQLEGLNKIEISGRPHTSVPDEEMGDILSVGKPLAEDPFDIKIGDVRLVGFPLLMSRDYEALEPSAQYQFIINVAIALPDTVGEDTARCYKELACQVVVALRHEQNVWGYLSKQGTKMNELYDEFMAEQAHSLSNSTHPSDETAVMEKPRTSLSPLMLEKKLDLPSMLKMVFEKVTVDGEAKLRVNQWSEVSFTLPIKAHNYLELDSDSVHLVKESEIYRFIDSMKPFHTLLLLEEVSPLIASLPPDSSPTLIRLLKVCSPFRNFMDLSADCDLELSQVLRLAAHLVYWAKARIVYPLSERNVYALTEAVQCQERVRELALKFGKAFPGETMHMHLARFSTKIQLKEFGTETRDVQPVLWLLQHRLIFMLHDYVMVKPGMVLADKITQGSGFIQGLAPISLFSKASKTPIIPTGETTQPSTVDFDDRFSNGTKEPMMTYPVFVQEYLTDEGRAAISIMKLTEADEMLFVRLAPFLTGAYHCEEIMYYEDLSKDQLLLWFDKFTSFLIVTKYADPAVAHWCSGIMSRP